MTRFECTRSSCGKGFHVAPIDDDAVDHCPFCGGQTLDRVPLTTYGVTD